MDTMEQNGAPVESEYARLRRAHLREQARARRLGLAGRLAGVLALVAAAYAAAGYFALVRLPADIARLEREVAVDVQARQSAGAGADLFRTVRRASGLEAAGTDPAKRFAALVQFARQPGYADLRGRGDLSALSGLVKLQAQLASLRKDLAQKQNRVKMLGREFEGALGKGSPAWAQQMQKARDAQGAAEAALGEAAATRDRQVKKAMDQLAALEKALATPRDATPAEVSLERARAWRDRLMVWPLSLLEKRIKAREP